MVYFCCVNVCKTKWYPGCGVSFHSFKSTEKQYSVESAMTINYSQIEFSGRTPSISTCSSNYKNNFAKHLMKTEFSTVGSAFSSKLVKMKKSWDSSSPYLTPDTGNLVLKTRSKKTRNFSSYPCAVNIYKANSDEFKTINRENNKKVKKSVLTLPNNSVAIPQTCTVSDMNDSSYFDREENKVKKNNKKRLPVKNNQKHHNAKKFQYYDRDAMYCSQMNIHIDCSSTHLMNHYNGDGNKVNTAGKTNASDVWSVLKNINKYPFRSSPTISECSYKPKKKRAVKKKLTNRRKQTYYETRETEEFAFVCVSRSISQCSSADRVTIINKVSKQISPHESDIIFGKSALSSNTTVPNTGNKNPHTEILSKIVTKIKPTKPRCKQNFVAESRPSNSENIKAFSSTKFDNDVSKQNKARASTAMPKLTLTEIRRRLANLKYPIVILDKDQVTSSAQFVTSNFLQFHGLENQIWPFMLDWTGESNNKVKQSSSNNPDCIINRLKNKTGNISSLRQNINYVRKINHDMNILKLINPFKTNSFVSNREKKSNVNSKKSNICRQVEIKGTKKPIPKREFTDEKFKFNSKMLLLNSITANTDIETGIEDDCNEKVKAQYCKNEVARPNYYQQDLLCESGCARGSSPESNISLQSKYSKDSILKRPWAKVRRVSDLIEGVLRKLSNGVYYNQEFRHFTSKLTGEDSAQACNFDEDVQSGVESQDCKSDNPELGLTLKNIEVVPVNSNSKVEITTLDTRQITIKHCVTNIIVHFDVTVPLIKERILSDENSSFSLIPLTPPATEFQYFKCKTTIVNAELPAEICSILPLMMQKIKDMQAVNFKPSLLQYDKKESQLPIIPEMASLESNITITPMILQTTFESSIQGTFSRRVKKTRDIIPNILYNQASFNKYDFKSTQLPLKIKKEFTIIVNPKLLVPGKCNVEILNQNLGVEPPNKHVIHASTNNIMTLQPYIHQQQMNIFHDYNVMDIIKKMFYYHMRNLNFTTPSYYHTFNLFIDEKANTITLMLCKDKLEKEIISVKIDRQEMKSLFINDCHYDDKIKCVKSIHSERNYSVTRTRKPRKRKFVKLYKKCKSTLRKVEKSSTSLLKISNMDDYFHALGSGKMLSSVCDGQIGNRIMSCLNEMKKWLTDITPRQALLVLLLNSRKETQNLRCCRPILLQGIAVNRITGAADLDMEIEVIEREKINVLQCEGISYIPSSQENKDSLFEELCWIAKTTASDYQKPFDKSSERLLKSLLEKRKKLNPSYLRVMARYVGLGLLKSQKSN